MLIIKAKTNEYLKNGAPVFVYSIVSTEKDTAKATKELDAYKAERGSYYRESESGEPLLFTGRVVTPNTPVELNRKGEYVVKSELQDLEAIAESTEDTSRKIQAARAAMERALGKKLTEDQLFALALKMATV